MPILTTPTSIYIFDCNLSPAENLSNYRYGTHVHTLTMQNLMPEHPVTRSEQHHMENRWVNTAKCHNQHPERKDFCTDLSLDIKPGSRFFSSTLKIAGGKQ